MADSSESQQNLKYFVGGIPSDAKRKDLYDYFKSFGVVQRITILNNSSNSKKLYGFCFVKFKKIYGTSLTDGTRLKRFQGRDLEIDPIIRRSNLKHRVMEKHAKRVFLQNLPKSFTKEDVYNVFVHFGPIANCFVVQRDQVKFQQENSSTSKIKRNSNYGYVIFSNNEDVDALLTRKYIELGDKTRIYIKKYSSSINRNNSEGDNPPPLDISSRNTLKRKPSNSETLSAGKDEEDKTPVTHFVKPTRRGYFEASDQRLLNRADNLRFNICSPPL